jgi:flagellar assembly protein FliH
LCQSIEEISGMRARLRREAEEDVVQLALAVARRILARELAVDPEAIRGLVIGALERLRGQEISRVRVHPAHAAAVRSCLQQMCSGTAVEVAADSTCAPGTVVVETPRGRLDASVDSQLREIERGLADRLRRRS